jgi:hypothetical protein
VDEFFCEHIELQKVVVLYVRIYAPIENIENNTVNVNTKLNIENFLFIAAKDNKTKKLQR